MYFADELVEQRVAGFVDACREREIKITPQRLEIFRELASTDEHPDAEEIYRRLSPRMPTISPDTVYRALALFEECGMAVRVEAQGASAHFDADISEHQHFVCRRCGAIRDLFLDKVMDLIPPGMLKALGRVDTAALVLRGLCAECVAEVERGRAVGNGR